MVLLGVRPASTPHDVRFLLQNTFEDKQFVEVSQEYLMESCAVVYFVQTDQTAIPDPSLPGTCVYAEIKAIDLPEHE
jgi:hypothetical protein